ncbi:MAG: hypothetical protein IPO02_04795 [Bacteroidetes bacterium]|nr:hypothetical protein [Bacteroidota bacterium]
MLNIFTISAPQETFVSRLFSQGNIRMNSDGTFSLYVHEPSEGPLTFKYTATTNGSESVNNYPTQYNVKNTPISLINSKLETILKVERFPWQNLKYHLLSLVDIEN